MNHFAFEVLFVLFHSLIRSLYFIKVYIFITLIHSVPFLRFSHIFAYTNFFICILPYGIFFLTLLMPLIGLSSEFNFNF